MGFSAVRLEEKSIFALPLRPFLVVINITPLPAWLPYNAAAEAPFNTVILSISSGFSELSTSPPSRPTLLVPLLSPHTLVGCELLILAIGTPSITYRGWFSRVDFWPRSITLTEPPTPDELGLICKPAILPFKLFMGFRSFTVVKSAL